MVVVDMEDVDGQSPKEGSKGSKRKSKREVSNHLTHLPQYLLTLIFF